MGILYETNQSGVPSASICVRVEFMEFSFEWRSIVSDQVTEFVACDLPD